MSFDAGKGQVYPYKTNFGKRKQQVILASYYKPLLLFSEHLG